MKKKDIFLDFTALLDVTLIVIFFFVIFSHLENIENTTKTEEKLAELALAMEKAEKRELEAGDLLEQLRYELTIVQVSDERTASNIEEILAFINGRNVKLIVEMEHAEWTLKVSSKNEVLCRISKSDEIVEVMKTAFAELGYTTEHTMLCELVFDGSQAGTVSAYRAVTKAIKELQKDYTYLYYSETDLSVGED